MKLLILSVIILFLLQYNFCLAQEQITTSYKQKEHPNIHITLNGKVKMLIQTSHENNPLCDAISNNIDSSYIRYFQCVRDTVIYVFDSNLLPEKINHVHCNIYMRNSMGSREEKIYNFENGNLVSENYNMYYLGNLDREYSTQYKYDSNGNMVYRLICSKNSFPCCESFWEYESYNRLIQAINYSCVTASPIKKPTYIEIFKYDTLGYLIEETRNDYNHNSYGKWRYVYDAKGNQVEYKYCKGYNGENRKKCKYKPMGKYVYDKNNRLIKEFTVGKRVTPHNVDYKYDDKGNRIEVKGHSLIWRQNDLEFHFVSEYNDDGLQTKEEEKTGNHPLFFVMMLDSTKKRSTLITTYDDNKNTIQEEHIINDETVTIIRYVYTYDSFGNWIKKETYRGKNEENLSKRLVEERVIEYY